MNDKDSLVKVCKTTAERRKEIAKVVKETAEKVRQARQEAKG